MKSDDFLNIKFSSSTLDKYQARSSIAKALKENITRFNGKLLDIGCGKMPYKDYILKHAPVETYIGLDIHNALRYDSEVNPDFTWDGITMPFESESFESALATEVLEHCPDPDIILRETYRVMKRGGCFFFTVPFLWNLHEVPHDEYRYTPFALNKLLAKAGFKNIDLKATGGWHASMAQMLGLWVRRANMTEKKRALLSNFLKPVIRTLIKKDGLSSVEFKEGQMITGISGTAYK